MGAWILFGPASAATWGGIGSVIGYSLGTAIPMLFFIFLGKKIRKIFPKGKLTIKTPKTARNDIKFIALLELFETRYRRAM